MKQMELAVFGMNWMDLKVKEKEKEKEKKEKDQKKDKQGKKLEDRKLFFVKELKQKEEKEKEKDEKESLFPIHCLLHFLLSLRLHLHLPKKTYQRKSQS